MTAVLNRAQMSAADINNLDDDQFAYIEPGGTRDEHGRTTPRSLRHFPIHDAAHVRNALARIGQGAEFADEATPAVHKAAKKMGIGDYGNDANRSQAGAPEEWGYSLLRSYALEDIEIIRGGDGRTVTAYAAMFGQPYEVRDQHGHYMEEIERSAFNRTISNGNALRSAVCLYNHGYTASGAPDALLSIPLGTPLEIRAEPKGLLTVTRYNKTAVADALLESIGNGDIRSQSFRGRVVRSTPERVPRVRDGSPLPTIVRNELGLSDYGPTPFAVNPADMGFAVRSRIEAELDHLAPEDRDEVIRKYHPTPQGDPGNNATPAQGPGAEDPPDEALRSALTQADIARDISIWRITKGKR